MSSLNSAAFERFAKSFQAGDIIFCEHEPGDSFYFVQKGRVRIFRVMGGVEKTIDELEPGEVFGEMAILEEAPRSAGAMAVDEVRVLELNKANFEILMQGNPQIAMMTLKLLTKRIYDQRRRFQILTLPDEQTKVMDVFLMLDERNPHEDDESNERSFPGTGIDDVAHWAGLPPERARAVISQFQGQNRLTVDNRGIVVHNIKDFERTVKTRRET